ncbi:MAG: DNA helicase, partial [Lachnospiraceae bacterium]|nr:DNA helicase [Lachnospiraceae bacterium]
SEFFDDWGSFTPNTETPFPQAIAEEPIEVKEDNSRIGNFYSEASDLYIPKNREDKIEKNLAAIRCLKNIEGGSEELTVDAQKTLACYTGWGGAAGVFDENYADFSAQREELKQLLTSEEYESARQSTLSSFYTEPWMINIIYEALQRFGFHGGTILEPAMGVGNFFRFLPKELRGSRLYGVELDSVTGRIAGLLYPDAKITLGGFETADYQCPNSYFDVCVGNIPFGSFKVWDTEFGSKWLIHDFFFAKGLSKVRPGGLLAFITSKGSMDKADDSLRRYMASHATFLGAIRLPSNAFVGYGGADVTTDILFFKKQASETSTQPFIDAVPMVNPEDGTILDDLVVNEYFVAHPEQMLGVMKTETGRFGSSVTTTCSFDGTREELLSLAEQAAERIEGSYEECEDALAEDGEEVKRVMYDPEMGVRNYTFTFLEGELFYREDNFLYSRKVNSTAEKRILWCCKVRDVLRNLLQMQADGCSDTQFEAGARELNRIYDSAIAKIGYLSNRANTLAFRDDADYPLLCSLENIDPADEDNVTKSEIFTKRSVRPNLVLMPVESAEDAIRCSIAESGKLDPGVLRSIYNPYGEDVKGAAYMDKLAEEVGDMLYRDPENNGFWVLADEYLSGNVRKKLLVATEAALAEPDKYTRNITALRNVLPLDVPISDISLG